MCQAAKVLRDLVDLDPPPADETQPRARRRAPRRTDATSRVVLLGTAGGSNPKSTRAGYSNAVVVGDAAYIVDCGEGVHANAWRSGISMHLERRPPGGATVRSIFLTHLHSDHVIDYANLVLGFWPTHKIDVFGPGPAGLPIPPHPPGRAVPMLFPEEPTPGLARMTELLFRAFAYNINERMADEGRHDVTACTKVHEIGVRRGGDVVSVACPTSISGSWRAVRRRVPPRRRWIRS
jgi:ribonuclease BN (tRNA processing enzyme)